MTHSPFDLNPKVFRSFELSIHLKDLFSQSEAPKDSIQLIELAPDSNSVSLEVPLGAFAIGHSLLMTIHEVGLSDTPELIIKATAKVLSAHPVSKTQTQIQLQLIQYEDKEFQKLLSLFSDRQDEISQFLSESKD